MENIKDFRTIGQFADARGYTHVRIRQLILEKRIETQMIGNKTYIHKGAVILPSKSEIKRAKKRQQFEKSLRKKK